MRKLPKISDNSQVRLGKDRYFDAWLYNFMIENNFAYEMNPHIIAGPEQIAFMVALEPQEVYMPCSDKIFALLMQPQCPPELQAYYCRAWRVVVHLVRSFEPQRAIRQRILEFCRYRFRKLIKEHIVMPSRATKRMATFVFSQLGGIDLWREKRTENNVLAQALLNDAAVHHALQTMPREECGTNITAIRETLNAIETARFMYLSAASEQLLEAKPSPLEWQNIFDGVRQKVAPLFTLLGTAEDTVKTILFIPDADGGFVLDLAFIACLLRMGHKVIVAVKSDFHFCAPTMDDIENDPILKTLLQQAAIINDFDISKNELLRVLRESPLVIINDGTRERLNLYRVNVTFARAWKEADMIIAKGWRNADTLWGSSQLFTRDVLCYWINEQGEYCVEARARARHIRKFSENDLKAKADIIIERMREARRTGKTVMFYSCIIGSIPGQIDTALNLVRTFVDSLRQKLADTFIVNPAEQGAEHMDGDDLMYMWERVQRSGYIDVWRFQTSQDIEESFALLERKVSPVWAGKDATFSTGCTKEMRIALDVQKNNHEMQIIGPDAKKFFRRDTYGVGKYFDARITKT